MIIGAATGERWHRFNEGRPSVELSFDADRVVITDADGDVVTLTAEQWLPVADGLLAAYVKASRL